MKIVEFMGPDASVTLPIKGDGGRERVIETLSDALAKNNDVEHIDLISQVGSYSDSITIKPVRFTNGLDPKVILTEAENELKGSISCDILHVHHPALLAAREFISARKVVLTHHGTISHQSNFSADGVTFVSRFLRDWMGDGGAKNTVIYNPVCLPIQYKKTHKSKVLGFMGTVHKSVKRVDIALDIADHLNIPILIAGPCDIDFLRNHLIPRLKNGSQYIGEVKNKERQLFIESVTCMVCPNDPPEAFCMVAAEAMASGTPVLASNLGGLPEVVKDGIGGFICNSFEDYIDAFQRLENIDTSKCIESVAVRFSPEKISQDYLHFFRELLEE